MKEEKLSVYLGGDIMTRGANLARQEEYDKFAASGLNADVYSPVLNKSINDKSHMTEDENNVLAEKITEADIKKLWNNDVVVMCPEQSAIGSLCEMGCLYGWKYMAFILKSCIDKCAEECIAKYSENIETMRSEFALSVTNSILNIIERINNKEVYAHYFDIRNNNLYEKNWRRSFSINQMLYGMILDATTDHTLHNSFDEVLEEIKHRHMNNAESELTDE